MTMTETVPSTLADLIRVDGYALKQALATVSPAISRRGALPVLQSVRLDYGTDGLTLTTTDLDKIMQVKIGGGMPTEPGTILLAHSVLTKLVADQTKTKASPVTIDPAGPTVRVGSTTATMRPFDSDEWPATAIMQDARSALVPLGALTEAAAVASPDEFRPILTGVYVHRDGDTVTAVGTDSYRIHAVRGLPDIPGLPDKGLLIPSKVIGLAAKTKQSNVVMEWTDEHVRFTAGNLTVTTKLIVGEFPNYRGLFPTTGTSGFVVTPAAVVDALKYLAKFAVDCTPVRVTGDAENVTFVVEVKDVGRFERSVPGACDLEFPVAYNPVFLRDMFDGLGDDPVLIQLVDGMKPSLVTSPHPEVGERARLLMPVRI